MSRPPAISYSIYLAIGDFYQRQCLKGNSSPRVWTILCGCPYAGHTTISEPGQPQRIVRTRGRNLRHQPQYQEHYRGDQAEARDSEYADYIIGWKRPLAIATVAGMEGVVTDGYRCSQGKHILCL